MPWPMPPRQTFSIGVFNTINSRTFSIVTEQLGMFASTRRTVQLRTVPQWVSPSTPASVATSPHMWYLLVDITCTHHVRHRCPSSFGNLLLCCFDVFDSQIGSTESGNPVWTYGRIYMAVSFGGRVPRVRVRSYM